jgi:DNA polymerase-3 subunit alpha
LFEYVEPFADYGFNASHACAYGYVTYQTAYLMAHHPVEYMAAILTSVKDDKDRKPYYLYACRGMGIEVLPPDVNESDMDFAPAPNDRRAIRYGLSAVRNVGSGVVQGIIEARANGGPFSSFADFCRRVEPTSLTKRVLESLIFAGTFDSLGYTRGGMIQQVGEQPAYEKVSAPIIAERKAEAAGQFSLFGGASDGPAIAEVDIAVLEGPELDKRLLLSKEKEMLGQFVTDHPLLGVEAQLAAQTTAQIPELEDRDDGELVVLGGIIGALARKFTKRGEPYAQFRLEGLTGGVEVVAFPSVYEGVPDLFEPDRIILVTGRIDRRGRELQIRASEVKEPVLDSSIASDPGVLVVDLPAAVCSPGVLEKLKTLLEGSPGDVPVRLRFLSSGGVQPLSLGAFTVNGQGSLLDELRHLLGPTAARLEHERA